MKRLVVAMCIVALAASLAVSQTTQPGGGGGRRGMNAREGAVGRGGRGITRPEREAAENWAQTHMPNLVNEMIKYPYMHPRRMRLQAFAVIRMRNMEQAANDPVLLEQIKQGIAAEEQIFQYVAELDAASAEQAPALRNKVRDAMRAMIRNLFQERQKRIDNLKQRLAAEEKRLAEDQGRFEQIVSNRLRSMAIDVPPEPGAQQPAEAPVEAEAGD